MIDTSSKLSIRRQSMLLGVQRSSLYYTHVVVPDESLLANEIYDIWHEESSYGYRRITHTLKRLGYTVNYKRVLRIMRESGIAALYPKPRTSTPDKAHKKYPYLLRNLQIEQPNQVWTTDITYIKMPDGWMYLVAILDVYSRYLLAWNLSNTLETGFCMDALKQAMSIAKPEILNTDQGCQFTSEEWIGYVETKEAKVSMDGVGRWADNIYIERFWRTIKYEELFLKPFESVTELKEIIATFVAKYNTKRLHQSLKYNTPYEVYSGKVRVPGVCRKTKREETQSQEAAPQFPPRGDLRAAARGCEPSPCLPELNISGG